MGHGARWLLTAVASVAIAAAIQTLGWPLPWMLGPTLAFAVANCVRCDLTAPRGVRYAGQLIIGTALGLYFPADVVARLADLIGWILLATTLSIGMGMIASTILMRVAGLDPATAYFAGTVGGAAEMANQAERHGARVDQVVATQITRVLLVVLLLPLGFQLAGLHGSDVYQATPMAFHPWALSALLIASVLCGGLAHRLGLPNGWLFGPLLLSAALTATDHAASAVPPTLINLGQWLIGCSLGARFAPAFLRGSPRFGWGVLASTAVLIVLCVGIASLIAALTGIPWQTMVLATAPGGIAEMGLTAKLLKLGVPIVTAFHIIRLTTVVLLAGPGFGLFRFLQARTRG